MSEREHSMNEFRYPEAERLDLTEEILGHQVSDPYRWMENDTSAERAGWLAAQADLFGSYREELPGRDRLAARVRELLSTGYVGTRPGGASGSSTPGGTRAPSTVCSAPRWVPRRCGGLGRWVGARRTCSSTRWPSTRPG